jgi:hypothetical protein
MIQEVVYKNLSFGDLRCTLVLSRRLKSRDITDLQDQYFILNYLIHDKTIY